MSIGQQQKDKAKKKTRKKFAQKKSFFDAKCHLSTFSKWFFLLCSHVLLVYFGAWWLQLLWNWQQHLKKSSTHKIHHYFLSWAICWLNVRLLNFGFCKENESSSLSHHLIRPNNKLNRKFFCNADEFLSQFHWKCFSGMCSYNNKHYTIYNWCWKIAWNTLTHLLTTLPLVHFGSFFWEGSKKNKTSWMQKAGVHIVPIN